MFVLTDRPSKLIGDASENNESFWNEVGNPILYKGQRRDFICNIQDNGSGVAQMLFVGQDLTADLIVSDLYYFQGLDLYQGRIVELTSVTLVGSDTEVDFITSPGGQDVPYVGDDDGFVNTQDKENYRIQYQVFRASDDAELDSVIFESSDSPGLFENVAGDTRAIEDAGIVYMNVSPIIRPYLTADIEADLTQSTEVFDDANAYIGFYIKYQEVWTGDSETQVDDSGNVYTAVIGARQIPATYGGNLAEFVMFEDGSPVGNILNKFTRPKIWRGFPFLVSVIIGDDISTETTLNIGFYDSDGDFISADSAPLGDRTGDLVIYDTSKITTIPDGAVFARLGFYKVDGGSTLLSVELECDIVEPCENPIMLVCRNSLGGVMQWVFDGNTERGFDYGNDIKAERRVLFAEDITVNEWNCLQDFIKLGEVYRDNILELTADTIKTSTRIGHQVYTVDTDGNKIGVLAIPTRNRTETRQKKHKFELEIEYPEDFTP